MDKITIIYKFELSNGEIGTITIGNVSETATDQDIIKLASDIIAGNTKIKGGTLSKLKSCTKSVLSQSEII